MISLLHLLKRQSAVICTDEGKKTKIVFGIRTRRGPCDHFMLKNGKLYKRQGGTLVREK